MIDLRPKLQPAPQRKHKPAGYIYLACPYTNPDPAIQLERVELARSVPSKSQGGE